MRCSISSLALRRSATRYTYTHEMPRAELYLSAILGERTSIGLDLWQCLDIDDLAILSNYIRSLPSLSKSSKTFGPTPSIVVSFVHVRLRYS